MRSHEKLPFTLTVIITWLILYLLEVDFLNYGCLYVALKFENYLIQSYMNYIVRGGRATGAKNMGKNYNNTSNFNYGWWHKYFCLITFLNLLTTKNDVYPRFTFLLIWNFCIPKIVVFFNHWKPTTCGNTTTCLSTLK